MIPSLLFPHDDIRPIQEKFMDDFWKCLNNKRCMVAHAPTGLGKTAASLAPALTFAKDTDHKIFFLTSRHTQHAIVLKTVQEIQEKFQIRLLATSIIGKKWMCAQQGIDILPSNEFAEYCRHLKENGQCDFYSRVKGKESVASPEALVTLDKLNSRASMNAEDLMHVGREQRLCPYELALFRGEKSKVIVADYSYIFNKSMRERLFARVNTSLDKCIIIADEAHNVPERLRELSSSTLSSQTISQAIKEAVHANLNEDAGLMRELESVWIKIATVQEKKIEKDELIDKINEICPVGLLIERCDAAAEVILESNKRTAFFGIARFLEAWDGEDDGFVRIVRRGINRRGQFVSIQYECLDPGLVGAPLFNEVYSALVMSGTLTPTDMYADLLGLPNKVFCKEYENPFDKNNRKILIVPDVTSKFAARNEAQFTKIAKHLADIANTVPGNTAVFFPSYSLRDTIGKIFNPLCKKTVFEEQPGLTKEEKSSMLAAFGGYKKTGAVLLGVTSGSFGEGIDLPGDLLRCVVIVGIPLTKPDLETQALIEYYEEKFGRGMDYGYTLPAITKTIQNAGRCIRTETDRGMIFLLDERYGAPRYFRCLPPDWDPGIKINYVDEIKEFFGVGSITNKIILTKPHAAEFRSADNQ